MIVWDWGTLEPEETDDPAARAAQTGELKFRLDGRAAARPLHHRADQRPRDGRRDEREQWLLIHKRDEAAVAGWDAEDHPPA